MNLKDHIRSIPDYPKEGILFYDISTLLADGKAWQETVSRMADIIAPLRPDYVCGVDARGFLIGAAVAAKLGIGFVMVRKKGKLPGEVTSRSYTLEYGENTLEIQTDIMRQGTKAVLCDDLLATGGTAGAAIELIKSLNVSVVQAVFIIELDFLSGRSNISVPVSSLIQYDD
ncbi:MAG: adenine phosphoribosyltransferase [Alphaproteobacteria bacterium]|nr:adenine phosphoribosyltransferase [Alphaproteobacteria bacterium]MCL2505391.1 adenine phosphoribosyltransferase [Alphaproteobacteria bacterium]